MPSLGQAAGGPQTGAWSRIPAELRERPQWCLAGADKRPLTPDGLAASVNDPATWTDFDTACRSAAARGCPIGYVQTPDDPFACIDMDVKDGTPREALDRYQSIIEQFDSYTEHSLSGRGFHVWLKGKIGRGRRRDGVEVYSQARFIICTGNVVRDKAIEERQQLLTNMAAQLAPGTPISAEIWGDDTADWAVAALASADTGELGRLFVGDWEGRYPSQSEADLALIRLLLPQTDSPRECWLTFRLSKLGQREKAGRADYAQATLALAAQQVTADAAQLEEGRRIAATLDWDTTPPPDEVLDRLTVNWTDCDDAEVPDIVEGLIADEDVTLLGGHGGIGKSFLALQLACAVATGERIFNRETRPCRVLYYSAEDGRKRLARRLRRLVEFAGYDEEVLRQNLRVLDASDLEPLYGESSPPGIGQRSAFAKVLGPSADFTNLQRMVETFDAQMVFIDGASDTFDGNEIVRREVRAFVKMVRQVHPRRPVGVLLNVHIDRSSARGNITSDDGYAGSSQWHNSCRRRLFLQQEVRREKDELTEEWGMVLGDIKLRVMKNQDGPPDPDMLMERGLHGLWQLGVQFGGSLAFKDETDHGPTVLRLIAEYYGRGIYMSTSFTPQAHAGVFPTLRSDPNFPKGLSRKRTTELVRQLERDGLLVIEKYQRANRTWAERWAVVPAPAGAN